MSRHSLAVARSHSRRLPAFAGKREARAALLAERDRQLSQLRVCAERAGEAGLDASPGSLKRLEAWYFRLVAGRGFRALGTSREAFEDGMAIYFGHVVVATHAEAKWVVVESPFAPGHFSLGVERGLVTWCGAFRAHARAPANARRDGLWREYRKYFE